MRPAVSARVVNGALNRALTWLLLVIVVVEGVAMLIGPREPTGPAWSQYKADCAAAGGEVTMMGESWVCLLTHPQPETRGML